MRIRHSTRIILAGMMGNLIESFDMAICGLMSVYMAKNLIGNERSNLFIIFSTFFMGYLARPIGAVFIGIFSDIHGRKTVLSASILSMGITTALIGIIPTHQIIGIGSVLMLLLLRIIQSFSCGAEYLNSSAYLIECADQSNRGFSGSWASFGTMAGNLFASLTMLVVIYFIEKNQDLEWLIWRLPFILALLGSSIGLYIRFFSPESLDYVVYYADNPKLTIKTLINEAITYISKNKLTAIYVFALSGLGVTTTVQIYIYAPIQAHIFGHFTDQQIIVSNIISLTVMLCLFPFAGKLTDRMSRTRIVTSSSVGFLILTVPFFYTLSYGSYRQFILMQSLISLPATAYYATVPVMLAEMFPLRLRCTVLSILYSIAASLSAGLTPLLSYMLLDRTKISTSPSLLVIGLVIFSMLTMRLKYSKNQNDNRHYA